VPVVTGPVAVARETPGPSHTTRPHEVRVVRRPWWLRARDVIANRTGLFWIVSAFGAFWAYGFFRDAREDGDSMAWSAAQALGMSLLSIGGAFAIVILLYVGRAALVAAAILIEWVVVNGWRGVRHLLGERESTERRPTKSGESPLP
jgi:hypothetical protein